MPYPVPHGPGLMVSARANGNRGDASRDAFQLSWAGPCRDPPPGTGRSHSGFRSHVCFSRQDRPSCIQRSADQINDRLNTRLVFNGKPEVP